MSANKYPPYQDPALPGEPTPEDLAAFTQPVAEMDMSQLPTPVAATRPAKGLSFDWSALNAQTQEEYDAKPPALQHLIHEIKNTKGLQPTPEWAANRIIEIQRAIDEQNSPKAQAQTQAAKLSAEKTLLEKTKLEQEQIAEAKKQAELAARKSIVLSKIEKYTNPNADGYVNIEPLVGKWDGTAGTMFDAVGADDQRSAQRAELERLVNTDVLELTKFLKPVSQDELKFLKSMTPRLHQNDTIWKEYLLDAKSRLQAIPDGTPAAAPQQPTPQAPPAKPPEYKLGSQRLLLNPQTGKYYVAPATPGR